jgi:hypothetical protein
MPTLTPVPLPVVPSRPTPPDTPRVRPLSAEQKRARQPALRATWSVAALAPALPLTFPVDPELPPSPKHRYRSTYQPPDPAALPAPADWRLLSDFELALALIDCSPLERPLAAMYRPSAKGQVPFHPVSLLLAVCLRRELGLGWRTLARLLAGPHGAGWRARLGFVDGQTPSASGLRYFFQTVGADAIAALCPQFVGLLRAHGLCPEHSTYPGDPPDQGVTVCQDGMLHPARGRPSCQLATDACYQPLPAPGEPAEARPAEARPPAATGRPCRAREQEREGCTCTTPACRDQCVRASRLDPEARFIHYAGRDGARGTDVFGYRSVAERVLDDRVAVAWTLTSGLYPANTDERTIFVERVQALTAAIPDLAIGEWLDDTGVGYGDCLDAVWQLGALRMIDIRADPSDRNPAACLARGYDGTGRPLCPHGYRLRANGYDHDRRRAKYVCAQACRRDPPPTGPTDAAAQPVTACPFLDPSHPLGVVVNVGRTLPDGSRRLARDIPVGSDTWNARYGRRNLAESRNGQLEGRGLKRLPTSGLPQATKELQVADFLLNLHTFGRLVRQASTLTAA